MLTSELQRDWNDTCKQNFEAFMEADMQVILSLHGCPQRPYVWLHPIIRQVLWRYRSSLHRVHWCLLTLIGLGTRQILNLIQYCILQRKKHSWSVFGFTNYAIDRFDFRVLTTVIKALNKCTLPIFQICFPQCLRKIEWVLDPVHVKICS